MFYDSGYSFREMVVIWLVVIGVWGVSLVVALKMAHIELTALQRIVVIQVAGITALVPVVGPFLAPVVVIYLIYRMADSEFWIVLAAVLVTRFIAALIAIVAERALVQFGLL
jgi:hypothetical protein